MKKTIRSKVYDTEAAELVASRYSGTYGDPTGYSEELFRTAEGFFFLYTAGGEESPYAVEKIKAMSADAAEKWKANLPK